MPARRTAGLIAVPFIAVLLSGCSLDMVVWGPDGARVIETTERLIRDLGETGETGETELACDDVEPRFGEPEQWVGREAGEPEQFHAPYWPEQADLDPQWNINLEMMPPGTRPGDEFPGDVFFRQSGTELCVVDVTWSTLLG